MVTVDDVLSLPFAAPDRRLPYGADPEQFGELYLPARRGRRPLVILLHGGCWQARYGSGHLGPFAAALRNEGLAVWNMEYRRLGNGGGWPATFADVAAGADFLRDVADRFSLDLSQVVAAGHSAGGLLALWLAGRHRLEAESPLFAENALPLRGVVSLAGICDLAEGVKRNLCEGACRELLGGGPEEVPDRYRAASPVALLPLGVPQRHLVGLLDGIVPADHVQRYVTAAGQHDDARLTLLPDAGHYDLIVPATSAWVPVRDAVLTLLDASGRSGW